MEYREDDFLMVSGIQHFTFCRRQWALIHIEQQWKENEHTIEGELLHKKAHDPYLAERRGDVMISRALPVYSRSMGVSGECDIVEFHRAEDSMGTGDCSGYFRWNIKRGVQRNQKQIYCSWWHRPCVWRKCCQPGLKRGRCITERFTAGMWWRLQMNCENG